MAKSYYKAIAAKREESKGLPPGKMGERVKPALPMTASPSLLEALEAVENMKETTIH